MDRSRRILFDVCSLVYGERKVVCLDGEYIDIVQRVSNQEQRLHESLMRNLRSFSLQSRDLTLLPQVLSLARSRFLIPIDLPVIGEGIYKQPDYSSRYCSTAVIYTNTCFRMHLLFRRIYFFGHSRIKRWHRYIALHHERLSSFLSVYKSLASKRRVSSELWALRIIEGQVCHVRYLQHHTGNSHQMG